MATDLILCNLRSKVDCCRAFFGLNALSDFADYVQKQQALRKPPRSDVDSAYGSQSVVTDDHAELDIIDSLGLAEESTQ
ncbi:hypothetical protein B0A49_10694, partial [Cryomyces minteri]